MQADFRESGLRYLFFRVCGRTLAMEILHVEEVIVPREVVPAPPAPDIILGVVNVRGRVVTVLALARILGFGEASPEPSALVVLRLPDMALAVGADALLGIRSLPPGELGEMSLEETSASPVKLVFQHEGSPVHLLDMERLISFIWEYDYHVSR